MKAAVVVSCEHASASVPPRFRSAFRGAARALRSHRGSDIGARVLARQLAGLLRAPMIAARATRLLADPNRSLHHPGIWSEWSRSLPAADRQAILELYWHPHRRAVERECRRRSRGGRTVLHLSVHTFTPSWHGVRRPVDLALLYDPRRVRERAFVDLVLGALAERQPRLRLRRNHPYRGNADGLTTHLRKALPAKLYLGIEVEVSQRFPLGEDGPWHRLRSDACAALRGALGKPADWGAA